MNSAENSVAHSFPKMAILENTCSRRMPLGVAAGGLLGNASQYGLYRLPPSRRTFRMHSKPKATEAARRYFLTSEARLSVVASFSPWISTSKPARPSEAGSHDWLLRRFRKSITFSIGRG